MNWPNDATLWWLMSYGNAVSLVAAAVGVGLLAYAALQKKEMTTT
ncbi:MAG TPA: hypothetical protein VKD90_30235 [Gemmataceae bacterium]|nr:hypothetical protein [Gemmataceae bacterium]